MLIGRAPPMIRMLSSSHNRCIFKPLSDAIDSRGTVCLVSPFVANGIEFIVDLSMQQQRKIMLWLKHYRFRKLCTWHTFARSSSVFYE